MCEAFAGHGMDVELVVPWKFNHLKEDPFSYYNVSRSFKIKKVFSLDLIRFGRIGFWIQSLSFAKSVFIYLVFKRVDVIYSRDELPIWFLSFFKKNLIYEAHMPRFNFTINRFNKIITISQGLKDFYIKKGVGIDRVLVARDSVDLEGFNINVDKNNIRKKLGIPLDKPVVMYLGRLDPWKGVETLLEASLLLPKASTVIVGEGSQFKKFKAKYPNVIFLGSTPYRDLPYNQKAADVLVVPNSSKSDISRLYTSPLKVFAHMASGVPIVASDLPSIKEVLNEKNSTLVEADNSEALANGIKNALSKDGKKALDDVEQHTWEKRAKNIVSFITQ